MRTGLDSNEEAVSTLISFYYAGNVHDELLYPKSFHLSRRKEIMKLLKEQSGYVHEQITNDDSIKSLIA